MKVRRVVVLTMVLSLLAALCPAPGSASVGADDTYGTWRVSRILGSWAEGRMLAGQSGPQATVAIDNRSESRNRDLWTAILQKAGANGYPQTVTLESSEGSVQSVIAQCPDLNQGPLCFADKGVTVPVGRSAEWTVALSRPDQPGKVVFKATPDFRAAVIEFTSLVYKALATIFVTEALRNSGTSCASAVNDSVLGEGVDRLFDALVRSGRLVDEIDFAVRANSLGDLFARLVPQIYDILQGATLDPANSLDVLARCSAGIFSTGDLAKRLNTGGILLQVQLIWAVFTVTVQLEGQFLLSALRDLASPHPLRGGLDTMIVAEYTPPTLPPTRSPLQPTLTTPPASASAPVLAIGGLWVGTEQFIGPGGVVAPPWTDVLITLNPPGRRTAATIDLAATVGPRGTGAPVSAACWTNPPGTRPCESAFAYQPNLASDGTPAFGSVAIDAVPVPSLPPQMVQYDSQGLRISFPTVVRSGPFEIVLGSVHAADGLRYRVSLAFTLQCPTSPRGSCAVSDLAYSQVRLP